MLNSIVELVDMGRVERNAIPHDMPTLVLFLIKQSFLDEISRSDKSNSFLYDDFYFREVGMNWVGLNLFLKSPHFLIY